MPYQPIEEDYLLPRGVYHSAVLGPNGEPAIIAVDHRHRRFDLRYLQPGDNPFTVLDEMYEALNEADPVVEPPGPPEWLSQAG